MYPIYACTGQKAPKKCSAKHKVKGEYNRRTKQFTALHAQTDTSANALTVAVDERGSFVVVVADRDGGGGQLGSPTLETQRTQAVGQHSAVYHLEVDQMAVRFVESSTTRSK